MFPFRFALGALSDKAPCGFGHPGHTALRV